MVAHLSSQVPTERTRTVLVVEDDPILRFDLTFEIREAGYRVLEAANTDEAETVLDTIASVDLVITDVQMPGARDGLALATIVRATRPDTKVIVASGRTPPATADELADAFFSKPYDMSQVIGRIDALIGARDAA